MIGKLKALGLALVATLAIGAVAASGAVAQEQGVLTSDGPVLLQGTEVGEGENYVSAFGQVISCPGSAYQGEALGGGPIESGATSGTLVPTFNQATCGVTGGLKATIDMNGCDVVFNGGETIGEGEYEGSGELSCEAGEQNYVLITVFLSASNENIKACTIKGEAQSGSGTGILVNKEGGTGQIQGTITGINGTKSGLCGSESTESAEIHFNAEVIGVNEEEEMTEIEVSH